MAYQEDSSVVIDHRTGELNPFHKPQADHIAAGAVAVESQRATAEVQARMVIAKTHPRQLWAVWERLSEECTDPEFAKEAMYEYPRSGQQVRGPSVRLAEAIARCMGNIEYGLKELSNKNGESEMEAFAWDLETNVRDSSTFVVKHIRDKKGGVREPLKDGRDIYELTANMGARRMRARILAITPAKIVRYAVDKCHETIKKALSGGDEPIADRVRKMLDKFKEFGVVKKELESYLKKTLDECVVDDIVKLMAVYQGLKDGQYGKKDYFGAKSQGEESGLNKKLEEKKEAGNEKE